MITCSNLLNSADYTKITRPVVSLDSALSPDISMVCADYRTGGRAAASMLIRAGCKRVLQFRDSVSARLAELGCGGGRNAAVLLKKYPSAHMTAVDASPLCAERTRKYNARAVAAGKCAVQQGDVSALTLQAEAFDLATAFETVYFWSGLEVCFAEVRRILKPGGLFLIVNESDGTDKAGAKREALIDGMRLYAAEEIRDALERAGFSKIWAFRHDSKPWLTVLAEKPEENA